MNKETLVNSASQLAQPSEKAALEFAKKSGEIVSEMNRRLLERPDINNLVGENNLGMMQDNHANQIRFMSSMFHAFDPEVLVDTIIWVFRAYRSHGFNLTYWPAQLNTVTDILRESMTKETFSEIYPYYNWMIIHNPSFALISDEVLKE